MKRKLIYLCIPLVLLAVLFILYPPKNPASQPTSAHFKCPENYTEDDIGITEYRNALSDWTLAFFEINPTATMSDWSMAKTQLWRDNNCAIAIQRSKLSGKVADLKPWQLVDYEIQNTLDKAIDTSY